MMYKKDTGWRKSEMKPRSGGGDGCGVVCCVTLAQQVIMYYIGGGDLVGCESGSAESVEKVVIVCHV